VAKGGGCDGEIGEGELAQERVGLEREGGKVDSNDSRGGGVAGELA
jgi:hypothetical protein